MWSYMKKRHARRSALLLPMIFSLVVGTSKTIDVSVNVPKAVAENSTVNLTCAYNIYENLLYSVKWYKGPDEFFRYIPKEMPPIKVFSPFTTIVNENKSSDRNVVINNVPLDLAGKYRCEVSTDSPNFYTRSDSGYMYVASLPEGKVTVSVEKPRYAVGDTVRGNCTAPPGYPPANVTWTVNGHPVNASYMRAILRTKKNSTQFNSIVAGLDFEIIPDSFKNGRLHIICHADVFQLYSETAEIVLEEERPRLASVLGTRESNYIGSAAKYGESWMHSIILLYILSCILR